MSTLIEHLKEQEELTELCNNGLCGHKECCDADASTPAHRATLALTCFFPAIGSGHDAQKALIRHLADIYHLCDVTEWSWATLQAEAAKLHQSEA